MRSTAIVIAASLLALASASCPNQCSGHGRCNEFDQCECYRQQGTAWGQRLMYTGPDCSQRTCPMNIGFADLNTDTDDVHFVALKAERQFNGAPVTSTSTPRLGVLTKAYKLMRPATFQVRVLDTPTTSVVRIQWKLAEHDKFSAVQDVIASSNAFYHAKELQDTAGLLPSFGSSTDTGVEIYFTSTTGVNPNNLYEFTVNYHDGRSFITGDANSAHQDIECSGRGTCDRTAGQCKCFTGYTGEACQRTTCPNECSGHGICQDLSRFVADAEATAYTSPTTIALAYNGPELGGAYDAKKFMGCLCDEGYRGPDCSMIECPSGDDPMGGPSGMGVTSDDYVAMALDCSGRGSCDYTTGQCMCFKGFFGERCESQTTFV